MEMKKGLMFGYFIFALIFVLSFSVVSAGVLGNWFTGNSGGATGKVTVGDTPYCVSCAAPPYGCNYIGGTCEKCGELDCPSDLSCTDSDRSFSGFKKSLLVIGKTSASGGNNIPRADYCKNLNVISEAYCSSSSASLSALRGCNIVFPGDICFDGACRPKTGCEIYNIILYDKTAPSKDFYLPSGENIQLSLYPPSTVLNPNIVYTTKYIHGAGTDLVLPVMSSSSVKPTGYPSYPDIQLELVDVRKPAFGTRNSYLVRLRATACFSGIDFFGFCGDGVIQSNELCDGTNLNGKTCPTLGYVSGSLRCTSTCTFDVRECHFF